LREGLLFEIEILWGPENKEHSWLKESWDHPPPHHRVWVRDGHEKWSRRRGGCDMVLQRSSSSREFLAAVRGTVVPESPRYLTRSESYCLKLQKKQRSEPVAGLIFGIQGLSLGFMCSLIGGLEPCIQTL
jgi:hypothetical protein